MKKEYASRFGISLICPKKQNTHLPSWNSINQIGAEFIANGIRSSQQISYLNLGLDYNAIGEMGTESILKSLEGLSGLMVLILNMAY